MRDIDDVGESGGIGGVCDAGGVANVSEIADTSGISDVGAPAMLPRIRGAGYAGAHHRRRRRFCHMRR